MNIQGQPTSKELRRTREGRIVAGVCSGAGEFVGIDANIIRLGLAVATLFGGLGIGIYAVAWLLIPDEGKRTSIVQDLITKQKDGSGTTWQQFSSYWQPQSQRDGHAPYDEQPSHKNSYFGDQSSYQGQSPYADRPASSDQSPYADRPSSSDQSPYAARPARSDQSPVDAPQPAPQSPTSRPQSPVDEPPTNV